MAAQVISESASLKRRVKNPAPLPPVIAKAKIEMKIFLALEKVSFVIILYYTNAITLANCHAEPLSAFPKSITSHRNKILVITALLSYIKSIGDTLMKLTKSLALAGVALALTATSCKTTEATMDPTAAKISRESEHYTFELKENVSRTKVTFRNHFGIELAGDLYAPKNAAAKGKHISTLSESVFFRNV